MDQTIYLILAAAVFIAIAFVTIVLGTDGITKFGDNSDSIQDKAADKDITGDFLQDFSEESIFPEEREIAVTIREQSKVV
jgi:hypothetical protein